MSYVEGLMDFGTPAITNSTTATISTNVYDAGSSKKVFGGPQKCKLHYRFTVSADCTGARIDFVGDTTAATLDTDGVTTPGADTEVIASTGLIGVDRAGDALGTGSQVVEGYLELSGQRNAMRYYGLFLTLAGTNPDATAGDAVVVLDAPSNMLGPQAAVPAT